MLLLCAGMNFVFAQIAAPTLNSPADGYVYPSTVKPNLKINSVSGASYYMFHWSEDPTFATYSSYTMSSSYTGLNVNGLKFGTTYYWRVYAITANYADTSAASAVRSFTTTDAPTLTSPSDGAILSNSVRPNIRWTEITGASRYIYQCDTSSSFDSPLCLTYTYNGYNSNGSNPNQLHFGKTYYLRMKATNSDDSDTSAWSAVRSFTTCDAPTITSPNDGVVFTSTVRPTIKWTEITGASKYIYQCDTSSSFDSPLCLTYTYNGYNSNGANPNQLHFGKTYYLRMKATNSDDSDTSAWSAVRTFTTCDAPTLSSPSNGSTLSTVAPTAYYNTITGANGYLMQWSEDPDFATYEEYSLSSSNNALTLNGLKFSTTYYWRVCAFNSNSSDTSSWSEVWSFTTSGAPTLSSPTNGSTLTTVKPTAYYNTISGATGYLMQWSEDPNFATYEEYSLSSSNNGLTLTRLKFGTTYYWRVCAINNNSSATSAWSEVWSFTTTDGVPTLSTPTDGSTLTTVQPTLYYNTVSGAGGYLMQWSKNPDFATYEEYSLNSSNNGLTLTRLEFGTTYYWRVCAINNNSSDISAWSDVWSFTTANGVPTLVSPADGYVYPSTVKPLLRLEAVTGASYYLFHWSEDPTFATYSSYTMSSSYTGLNVNGLKFGTTYYWRVFSITSNYADTSASSAVWSFTTTDAPTITAPNDGTILTNSISPNIQWTEMVGATKYIYQCDTSASFNSPVKRTYTVSYSSGGSNPLNLRFGATYYLRMRATNTDESDTSAWSAVRTFITSDAPVLNSPSNGYVYSSSVNPTLKCETIRNIGKYIYQWDTTSNFNSPLCRSTVQTSTSVTVGPLKLGTTYYWRMCATNYNDSDTSSWSAVWSFTTGGSIPTLASPSNGSTAVRLRPTLDWNAVSSCDYYDYECDTTPQFNSPELQSGAIAAGTSEIRLNQLRYGTTYYWRVRIRLNSDTSSWSTVWSFTTAGTIALTSPANGTTLYRYLHPTLDWDFINDGDYYEYQYDLSPDFDSPELVSGLVAVGTSEVDLTAPMRFGTTYYWRVREYTSIDTTPWSATWSFTTPGEIALVSPANGSTLSRTLNPTLDWDYINGGDTYEYQYDLSPDFDSPELVTGQRAVGTSEIDITTPLRFGTTYYWRVRETTSIDTTPWSETWSFTTPGEVVLVSPANGTTNVGSSTTLDWDYIRGGSLYEYQYDTCSTFDSPGLATGTIAVGTSQVSVSGLRFGTTYYWRVRETSPVDTTDWSEVWHFTTTNGVPTLTSPSDGYVYTNSVKATVYWNSVTGAGHYIVAWDTVPTFDSPLYETFTATASSIYITELNFGTTYYWKVCSINSNDSDTSSWSTVWRFTTSDAPVLTSPADGTAFSSYSNSRLTVYWNSVTGADHYILEWDTAATFNSPLFATFTASGASVYITEAELQYGTTYYWRVCAINSNAPDTSSWSTVWRFTTPYQLTTGPTLISPANDSSDIDFQSVLALQWDELDNVSGYRYQVSTSSDFSTLFAQGTTAQTTASIHNLRPATTYYWRVQGYNGVGNSVWSAVWHFTTGGCPPIVTSFTHEICEGELPYHYINGDIDTTFEVGTPQLSTFNFQLLTPLGCDSTVTLHLTVHPAVTSTSSVTVCESDLPYHYVDGEIDTTFDVGTPNLSTITYNLTTGYGCDSTVTLTVNINQPVENETYMTACDEYEWNGETLTASGDYTATFTAASGCDSVVTLHLTINVPTESDTTATACGSFNWHGYTNLTESGDYTDVLENAEGCDSIVTLHLTINTPTESDTSATACGSFSWHGYTNLTESGDYTDVLENAAGCDSIVTLHLTVNQPVVTEPVEVTICENDLPYHYVNGAIDTTFEVGTPNLSVFNFQFSTQYGCDSTVILTLNVHSANYTELTETACGNYTWNNEVYEESGDYVQTFTNASGCDSVVTLHLTIFTADYADFAETACGSYTWNDEVYTESGDYVQTFTNANGCDSVVTLHLTVITINTEVLVTTTEELDAWSLEVMQEGAEYQWIDCETNETIEGEVHQRFNPAISGQYACVITMGECTDTTECIDVTISGIDDYADGILSLYPNPTTGMVNVQFTMNNVQLGAGEIQVLDVYGRLLQTVETCHGTSLQIDLSHYATGIYLVRWVNGGKVVAVRKVVKE